MPCPWCGHYTDTEFDTSRKDWWQVWCMNGRCAARGPVNGSRSAAVVDWNLLCRARAMVANYEELSAALKGPQAKENQ